MMPNIEYILWVGVRQNQNGTVTKIFEKSQSCSVVICLVIGLVIATFGQFWKFFLFFQFFTVITNSCKNLGY